MKRLRPLLALAAGTVLLLPGCFLRHRISGEEAHALVDEGAVLLDVRSEKEFKEGHIAGAVHIPVGELEARVGELAEFKDKPIVVYCKSGLRSARAKGMLEAQGFTKVSNLGGMSRW